MIYNLVCQFEGIIPRFSPGLTIITCLLDSLFFFFLSSYMGVPFSSQVFLFFIYSFFLSFYIRISSFFIYLFIFPFPSFLSLYVCLPFIYFSFSSIPYTYFFFYLSDLLSSLYFSFFFFFFYLSIFNPFSSLPVLLSETSSTVTLTGGVESARSDERVAAHYGFRRIGLSSSLD